MSRIVRSRGFLVGLAAIVIVVAAVAVGMGALEAGKRRAAVVLDGELQVLSRSIRSEVERFRYLPAVIAHDARIRDVLIGTAPDRTGAANAYLNDIRTESRADELYVMALDGETLAASNYNEPTSFVGRNYAFRPYFRDALEAGEGRYYAVGATTGIPGYFLSSAIRDGERVIGVAVVKVDMSGLEKSWTGSRAFVSVADADGVVFLTGHPSWRYRPLRPLSDDARKSILAARKYDGIAVTDAAPVFPGAGALPTEVVVEGRESAHLLRSAHIEPDGWTLFVATDLTPIRANASLLGLITALAGMLVTGAALYLHQRRQLVRAKLDEHDRLERRVVERTAELNREVEERKRAEYDLREAQVTLIQTAKLAALGRMSAAIVHEVSQPLTALENTLASTGLLARRGGDEAIGDKVGAARDLVRRIQRTVKLLRSFARKDGGARETVRLDRCVRAAVEIVAHRAEAEKVALEIMPGLEAYSVKANPVQFEQVILNLLANALDAVSGRERPTVSVSAERAGENVVLTVSDNGAGVADELRDRIAEPFFTTKETGEGLGLGLSISRAIVTEFGGTLTFASREGDGSTFAVRLPSAADSLREAAE